VLEQCPIIPCIEKGKWKVYADYRYTTSGGLEIDVPKGFETDLASIPWMFRWRFPRCRVDYATASVVHDAILTLYTELGRELADKVFKEILDITTSEEVEEIFYESVSLWTRIKRWLGG